MSPTARTLYDRASRPIIRRIAENFMCAPRMTRKWRFGSDAVVSDDNHDEWRSPSRPECADARDNLASVAVVVQCAGSCRRAQGNLSAWQNGNATTDGVLGRGVVCGGEYLRPRFLAEVADLTLTGAPFDYCLANFLDEFYRAPRRKRWPRRRYGSHRDLAIWAVCRTPILPPRRSNWRAPTGWLVQRGRRRTIASCTGRGLLHA